MLALGVAAWWLASAGRERPALEPIAAGAARDEEAPEELALPTPVAAIAPERVEEAPRSGDAPRTNDAPAATDPSKARRGFLLHVVDAKTGAELRDCVIRWQSKSDGEQSGFSADFPAGAPIARGDSPLRIEAPREGPQLDTLMVAVDRYATATFEVEWTGGGERTVALEPGASLTVVVPGAASEGTVQVQVRRADWMEERLDAVLRQTRRNVATGDELAPWLASHERALARLRRGAIGPEVDVDLAVALRLGRWERALQVDSEGRATFDDLPVGRWIVDASAPPDRPPRGAAEVVMTAGARVTIELPLHAPSKLPLVRATGIVRFDAGWLESGMPPLPTSFEVRPSAVSFIGPLAPGEEQLATLSAGDRREELRFDAGELPPGLVVARFGELFWSTRFDVPEAGSDSIVIVVPPPTRVAVRVFDASAPDVAIPFQVGWEAFDGAGSGAGYPYGDTRRSVDGSPVDLLVPRGALLLFAGTNTSDFFLNRSRHELTRASEEIAIELRAHAKLAVTLRDGQAIVPCDHDWSSRLYALDTRDQPLRILCWETNSGSPSLTITFDRDGPARLHLEPVDGYAMVAPVPFELKRGETVQVELPITRARR